MLDETEFLSRLRRARALASYHARNPYVFSVDGMDAQRCATSRASRTPACSAATRTGAARSGSRSTTCSSSRCRSSTTTTATTSRSSARPAPGTFMTHRARSPTSCRRRLTRLFLRGRATAAGPCSAQHPQAADRPALPRLRAVPRVLPRRHRPRRRRLAPDRLDRPGREAAAAACPRRQLTRHTAAHRTPIGEPRPHGHARYAHAHLPRTGDAALPTAADAARPEGAGHRRELRHRPRHRARSGEAGADVVVNYVAGEDKAQRGLRRDPSAAASRRIAHQADVSRRGPGQRDVRAHARASSARSTSWSTTPACSRTRRSRR